MEPAQEEDVRPTIFISHRTDDAPIAARIARSLQELYGDRVRIFSTTGSYTDRVPAAGNIRETVKQALADCSLLILVYTGDQNQSAWTYYECGLAIDPAGDVPTREVVVHYSDSPPVFEDQLNIRIESGPDDDAADRQGETVLRGFLTDLARGDDYVPGGAGLADPDLTDEDLARIARSLHDDLYELGPEAQERLTRTMLDTLTRVPVGERRGRFEPLLDNASGALRWGLNEKPAIRDLFLKYWDQQFLRDLTHLAQKRLVFNPGRVSADWTELLEVLGDRFVDDERSARALERPVLSMVSYEEGDPFGFWERAQQKREDAYHYELPVRALAKRLKALDLNGLPVVRRVIVVAEGAITTKEHAERLAAVARWMGEVGIETWVSYVSDVQRQSEWRDFGIVGDIAVSRFNTLERSEYRALMEDFDPDHIKEAVRIWGELPERWSSAGGIDADEVMASLGTVPDEPAPSGACQPR